MRIHFTAIPSDTFRNSPHPRARRPDLPQNASHPAPRSDSKSNFFNQLMSSHFMPKFPSRTHPCGADILSIFGWRYQKQGSKNSNLRISRENRKNILSAFGWRYQKRGFLPPFPTLHPSRAASEFHILRHSKNQLTFTTPIPQTKVLRFAFSPQPSSPFPRRPL